MTSILPHSVWNFSPDVISSLPALALGLLVPAVTFSALNLHLFGSPLTTSYDRMARIEGDVVGVHSTRSDFGGSAFQGARNQIMDRSHGLFFTSPITPLSLAGFIPLARKNRAAAFYILVTSLSIFLFLATYREWAASHHGNRYLMPVMILATVPLASLIDDIVDFWVWLKGNGDRGSRVTPPTTSLRTGP